MFVNFFCLQYIFCHFGGYWFSSGYIVFIIGSINDKYFPVFHWKSRGIRKVIKSTQAAQTLALVDLIKVSIFYKTFLCEILHRGMSYRWFAQDSCDLQECMVTFILPTQTLDKRPTVMAIQREMLNKKKLDGIIWVL